MSAKQDEPKGIARAVREGARKAGGTSTDLAGRAAGAPERGQPARATTRDDAREAMSRSTSQATRAVATADLASVRKRIADAAERIVREALGADAELGALVHGVVEGAIEGSAGAAVAPQDAATAAARGAVSATSDLGEGELEQVKRVVTGTVRGLVPLDEEVFARGRRTP